LRHLPDERERVSSNGACDRSARTQSERRLHHATTTKRAVPFGKNPTHLPANRGARNLLPVPDVRERVSSKGACDRRARTKSERRPRHASPFLKLRLVSARTQSERRLPHASLVPKTSFQK